MTNKPFRLSFLKGSRTLAYAILLLLMILTARLGVSLLLYKQGFVSLTADEFGRPVLAAKWFLHPTILYQGWWLPHYMYIYGLALGIVWNLIWTPRILTLMFGFSSICLIFLITYQLTRNPWAGIGGALLLAANPLHTWLSMVPLSDVPSWTMTLAFFSCLIIYLERRRIWALYLASVLLFINNGFRLEIWVLSGIFGLFLIYEGVSHLRRKRYWNWEITHLVVCALISAAFPLFWTVASLSLTGNPFSTLDIVQNYKSTHYGIQVNFLAYPLAFWRDDPLIAGMAPFILVYGFSQFKSNKSTFLYSLFSIGFLIAFVAFHRGRQDPDITYQRYLAIYLFLLIPVLMGLFVWISKQVFQIRFQNLLPILLLLVYSTWHIGFVFTFSNDSSLDGFRAGQYLKFLRRSNPAFTGKPVLIEQLFWDYLAFHVGANDITQIYYDRALDFTGKNLPSVVIADPEELRRCISQLRFSAIIVRNQSLKSAIEKELGLQAIMAIGSYSFYQIPDSLYGLQKYNSPGCSLSPGSGY